MEKKRKALATDAAKSRNIINMFAAAGAGGGVASGSGALAAPGPSQEVYGVHFRTSSGSGFSVRPQMKRYKVSEKPLSYSHQKV